jgi:hypothetical protein
MNVAMYWLAFLLHIQKSQASILGILSFSVVSLRPSRHVINATIVSFHIICNYSFAIICFKRYITYAVEAAA